MNSTDWEATATHPIFDEYNAEDAEWTEADAEAEYWALRDAEYEFDGIS